MNQRARVSALYRYPVKGFTPEAQSSLTVTDDGRAEGDRVWSLRFPRGAQPQDRDGLDYWPKGDGLCLRDFPSLAQLRVSQEQDRLLVRGPDEAVREYDLASDAGAGELVSDVAAFLRGSPDGARLREGLALVGDGQRARFQDRPRGFLSAHSRSSLQPLDEAMGADVDERRFRSNVAIEGWPPWAERELIGSTLRIGGTLFEVHGPIVRCLAVNADPDSGERNLRVLQSLTRGLGQEEPIFGMLLLPLPGQTGAVIREGDEVAGP